MKTRFALFFSILVALLLLSWLLVGKPALDAAPAIQIQLLSNPYPMIVGPMELTIGLSNADGSPIENAQVQVTTQLKRAGSPAILNFPNSSRNGQYHVPITWSMMGQAIITVNAELADESASTEQQFLVYVYLVPPLTAHPQTGYRNLTALNLELSRNAEREYWIYIPQGAKEMLMMSEIQAFVPNEIKLHLSGQNTFIIRNDDFVDHTVGPFFIRAGETIRQEFTQTAVFLGSCSISHGAAIRIIVEE